MDPSLETAVRSRRAVIAGGLAAAGAAAAHVLGRVPGVQAAAGQPLIMGQNNSAGTSNTILTTTSTGTALEVKQAGSGTALRGSALGANSIAGFFTSANGPGVSGVTASASKYAVFAGNDAATTGTGAALRAAGGANDGVVASTSETATAAVFGATSGSAFATALWGSATNTSGAGTGAYGETAGSLGAGVMGIAASTASAGDAVGVYGESSAGLGAGVVGVASGASGFGVSGEGYFGVTGSGAIGVSGISTDGYGVRGLGYQTLGAVGVQGESQAASGIGVYALTDNPSGTALLANAASETGMAIEAIGDCTIDGNLEVTGTVSGPATTLRIDHPAAAATKLLQHAAVESAERKTVYDGTVRLDEDGRATVELPAWMEALNGDFRYQLTSLDGPAPELHVARRIRDGSFAIAGGPSDGEVSWMVTGVRRDAWAKEHPVEVEVEKRGKQRGRYVHPAEHGRPISDGLREPRRLPEARPPVHRPGARQRPQRRPD